MSDLLDKFTGLLGKKEGAGIYIGKEGVSFARIFNKEISTVYISYKSIEEEMNAEDLNEDIKFEAIIQKGLRTIKYEGKEIILGIYENEIIFRFFDMPSMTKRELDISVPVEAEKYLPFKIEDLVWDFVYKRTRAKDTDVGFMGVKKDVFKRYAAIFEKLGLNIINVCPISFSLLRVLRYLNKISKDVKNFVLISYEGNETDIFIFGRKFFPRLGRFSKIPVKGTTGEIDVVKFVDELRLTFDYYRREMGGDNVEQIFFVCDEKFREYFSAFEKDLGIPTEIFTPFDVLPGRSFEDMESLKAYALAGRKFSSLPFEVNLVPKSVNPAGKIGFSIDSLSAIDIKDIFKLPKIEFKEVQFSFKLFILWLVVAAGVVGLEFTVSSKQIAQKKSEWIKAKESNLVPAKYQNLSIEAIQTKIGKINGVLKEVKSLTDSPQIILSDYLTVLKDSLSQGLWLDRLNLKVENNNVEISLPGYVFLGDEYKETGSLSSFIDKLSSALPFKGKKITLEFVERSVLDGFTVTKFDLEIR